MIIFGIMNHELERKNDNSKNIIHIIDTFLAHMAFVCILYDSYPNLFMMGGFASCSALFSIFSRIGRGARTLTGVVFSVRSY